MSPFETKDTASLNGFHSCFESGNSGETISHSLYRFLIPPILKMGLGQSYTHFVYTRNQYRVEEDFFCT